MRKPIFARLLLAIMVLELFATSACQFSKSEYQPGKSEYVSITEPDLVAYVQISYTSSQVITLAQTPQKRKAIIDHVKKAFAVAQAAQADELDKSEDFYKHLALNTARFLAREYSKRNENFKVSKADIDSYLAKRLKEFDADLAFTLKDSKQPQTTQIIESKKAQWAEMRLRAEKGRQNGIEKEAAFQQIVRLLRADILANIYLKKIKEQYKTTEADFKAYYTQHPEADPEKIKQRMSDLLTRVKKGDGFEKLADEINEDSTKGKGGDLGWFGEGAMAPELERAAFALQPGQISQESVRTNFGYHLIKVEGRRKAATAVLSGASRNITDPKAAEEVHAKHIYLGTKAGEEAISQQAQEKIERVIEGIRLKYPVNAPEDFEIKVAGLNQTKSPPASIRGKAGR